MVYVHTGINRSTFVDTMQRPNILEVLVISVNDI